MKSLPYLLLGVGAGLALAVLYAPRSGEETRGLLMDKAQEGKEFATQAANDGAEYVKKQASEFKKTAADTVELGRSSIKATKQTVADAVDVGKQAYQEAVSKA